MLLSPQTLVSIFLTTGQLTSKLLSSQKIHFHNWVPKIHFQNWVPKIRYPKFIKQKRNKKISRDSRMWGPFLFPNKMKRAFISRNHCSNWIITLLTVTSWNHCSKPDYYTSDCYLLGRNQTKHSTLDTMVSTI